MWSDHAVVEEGRSRGLRDPARSVVKVGSHPLPPTVPGRSHSGDPRILWTKVADRWMIVDGIALASVILILGVVVMRSTLSVVAHLLQPSLCGWKGSIALPTDEVYDRYPLNSQPDRATKC